MTRTDCSPWNPRTKRRRPDLAADEVEEDVVKVRTLVNILLIPGEGAGENAAFAVELEEDGLTAAEKAATAGLARSTKTEKKAKKPGRIGRTTRSSVKISISLRQDPSCPAVSPAGGAGERGRREETSAAVAASDTSPREMMSSTGGWGLERG